MDTLIFLIIAIVVLAVVAYGLKWICTSFGLPQPILCAVMVSFQPFIFFNQDGLLCLCILSSKMPNCRLSRHEGD